AAVLLGDRDREHAVLREQLLDVARVLLLLVDLGRPGSDTVLHELADRVPDRELLIREVEVHGSDYLPVRARRRGPGGRSRPAGPGSSPRRSAAPWRRGSGARRRRRPGSPPPPPAATPRWQGPWPRPCRTAWPSKPRG